MLFRKSEVFVSKNSEIPKYFLWAYRLLGLTFGGIDLNKGKVVYSQFWNVIGYLFAIGHIFGNFLDLYLFAVSEFFTSFSGHHLIVYTAALSYITTSVQILFNLWFIQKYGFEISTNFRLFTIQSIF